MMKKFIVFLFLLCPSFYLYAQSNRAAIYVPTITGAGGRPDDNDFFHRQLLSELTYYQFTVAQAQNAAEYILAGTLSVHRDNAPSGARQYVLHLSLRDGKTSASKAEGELVYEVREDIKDMFPSLVYTLLYTIPDAGDRMTINDDWRNKWLYAGARAFWTPRIYTAESTAAHIVNFGGGVFAEYHVLNFLSVGAGFEIAPDLIKIIPKDKESYSNILLEIPVYVKYVLKTGNYFLLEPYAGIHINIPFKKTTAPPVISWMAGFQYGVKLGPGVLFIDPRFSMDIGKSVLNVDPAYGVNELPFQRYVIHLGIGYKLGFLTKR